MLPNRILLSFFLCTKGNNKCFQELTRPKAAHGFSPYRQLPVSPQFIPGYMGSLGAGRTSSSWTTRLPPGPHSWNWDTQLLSRSGDTTGRSEHHTGGKGCVPGGKAHQVIGTQQSLDRRVLTAGPPENFLCGHRQAMGCSLSQFTPQGADKIKLFVTGSHNGCLTYVNVPTVSSKLSREGKRCWGCCCKWVRPGWDVTGAAI